MKYNFVKVRAEDLKWILVMPSYEFTDKAVKKSEEVKKRLWAALKLTDNMQIIMESLHMRKDNDKR
jgi:hypothetical protein